VINTNYPISILPAFSISSQLEFLRKRLDSIIYDQDQYHLTFFTSVLSKFENKEYRQFFPGLGKIVAENTLFWSFSNIGIFVTELNSKNIFFKASTEILSYIRKSLRESFDWVILITKTEVLIFSLYEQHYLCWSFLLQNYNTLILSLILTNPSEMDIYNNSYPLREYSLSLKCLKSVNKLITSFNNIKQTSYSEIQKQFSILSTFSGIQEVQRSFLMQIERLRFEKRTNPQKSY
jgi:hypothetical protein